MTHSLKTFLVKRLAQCLALSRWQPWLSSSSFNTKINNTSSHSWLSFQPGPENRKQFFQGATEPSVYKEVKDWFPGTASVVNKSRQELIKFQISHDFSQPFNCARWFNGQRPCSPPGLNNGAFLQSYGCSSWICHANINSRMQITLSLGCNYVLKQCLTGAARECVMEPADCRRKQVLGEAVSWYIWKLGQEPQGRTQDRAGVEL